MSVRWIQLACSISTPHLSAIYLKFSSDSSVDSRFLLAFASGIEGLSSTAIILLSRMIVGMAEVSCWAGT